MSHLSAYYSDDELRHFGFHTVGADVRVSRKCSLYEVKGSIGNHVRVDDFCILKGHLEIGSYVHIGAYCCLSGVCGIIRMDDFSTLSVRCSVYTGSDDYRANALSSSTVPQEFLRTIRGNVHLGRAALVGAHCVILPGVELGDACSVGALSVVYRSVPAGAIAVSDPPGVRIKGNRDVEKILAMAEQALLQEGVR
jgi:dTDP-4-amino-4,6-dideoxy-D-glucose acyltransferase